MSIEDCILQIDPAARAAIRRVSAPATAERERVPGIALRSPNLQSGCLREAEAILNTHSSNSPCELRAGEPAAAELLMVRPSYYGVEYEINPWMDLRRPADREAAVGQWEGLHRILTAEIGAQVTLLDPMPGLPDLVFTANAGLIRGDRVILSNFRHIQRQGEAPIFRRWFEARGLRVETLPPTVYFEGEGDALFLGNTLYAGYRWRSDARAHYLLGESLGVEVLSLELVDPHYYHLDTCFCPLDATTAAYFPGAFDDYALRVLKENVPQLIAVDAIEAARFACNAVVLGRHVALNSGCPTFAAELEARGFIPHATCLDEFLKAGGSAKCLTLYVNR